MQCNAYVAIYKVLRKKWWNVKWINEWW
jgi:hypothetical protein